MQYIPIVVTVSILHVHVHTHAHHTQAGTDGHISMGLVRVLEGEATLYGEVMLVVLVVMLSALEQWSVTQCLFVRCSQHAL